LEAAAVTTLYSHRDIAETCPGTGTEFNHQILQAAGSSNTIVVAVQNGDIVEVTVIMTTPIGDPGADGITGNHEVNVNIITGHNDISFTAGLTRRNSSCGFIDNSGGPAFRAATAGQHTLFLNGVNLGVWASGDRLELGISMRSTKAHGGEATVELEVNTVNAGVLTPWTLGVALEKNIDEDVNLVEAVDRVLGITRAVDEDVNLVEVLQHLLDMTRPIDEDVNLVEVANRVIGKLRAIDEDENLVETIFRTLGKLANVDDDVQIVEALASLIGRLRDVNDDVNFVEVLAHRLSLTRVINDDVQISESLDRRMSQGRPIDEDVNVVETALFLRGKLRFIDEDLNVVEAIFALIGQTRAVDETVQLVENVQFLITPVLDETENQGLTDVGVHKQFAFLREAEFKAVSVEPPAPPAGKVVIFSTLEGGKMFYKIKFPGAQVKVISQED
jgi:hypothetical protein